MTTPKEHPMTAAVRPTITAWVRKYEHHVTLDGAPEVHVNGVAYQPYALWFALTHADDGDPWTSDVRVLAYKAGHHIKTHIHAERLDEIPVWLDDIITRATPRDL